MAITKSKQQVDNRISPRYFVRVYEDDSDSSNPQLQAFILVDGDNGDEIGTTNPLPVTSGTGATDLGKAIDSVVGATDTGVGMLGKHVEDQVHSTVADGDYEILSLDSLGSLHVNAEAHHVFDDFNATTGWTILGDSTANIATTKKHVSGTDALTFDKISGATIFAGIQKTLTSVDLGAISPHDLLQGTFYIPTLTDVAYAFLRLGTDSSNYNEWRLPDTALTAAIFEVGALSIGDADYTGITGNGWDPSAITWMAVGVAYDAITDTDTGIVFDEISYHTNQHSSAMINAEVTSSVSSAKVDLQKINGSTVDKGQGNASNGSQRVVIADDDTNLSSLASGQLADGHNVTVDNTTSNPVPISVDTESPTWGTATHSSVSVATSSTTVIAANANRLMVTVTCNTNQTIFFFFGTPATTNGLAYKGVGSGFSISGDAYTGEITAIHSGSGTKSIKVLEVAV